MSKKLFILISDGGDGSYYPKYTFNEAMIDKLVELYEKSIATYENCYGCDGDGFHYEELIVPDECTYESLGIRYHIEDDYADRILADYKAKYGDDKDEDDEGYGCGDNV